MEKFIRDICAFISINSEDQARLGTRTLLEEVLPTLKKWLAIDTTSVCLTLFALMGEFL